MRSFTLLVALAIAALPGRATIDYCLATATDSSGNVQPWQCPNWNDFQSSSYLSASGSRIQVYLKNWVYGNMMPVSGLVIQYHGELETFSSAQFVVTGGSGSGQLLSMGLSGKPEGMFNGSDGYSMNGGGSEIFSSNFLPWPGGYPHFDPVTIPFVYGVPFTLTLYDDLKFWGTAAGQAGAITEYITQVEGTLAVFDNEGNPVSGAVIGQVVVPELSSVTLLATAVLLSAGAMARRARRAGSRCGAASDRVVQA